MANENETGNKDDGLPPRGQRGGNGDTNESGGETIKLTATEKDEILTLVTAKKKWVYGDNTVNPDNRQPFGGTISYWEGTDKKFEKKQKGHNVVTEMILSGNFDLLEKDFLLFTELENDNKVRTIRAIPRKYENTYKTGYYILYSMCLNV